MSEVLASLKKIGGNGEQYTETVLWTNPSPTADFAAQTVTLSESVDNFKYIGIRYCFNRSNVQTLVSTAIYETSELKAALKNSSTDHNIVSLALMNQANQAYNRLVYYVSPTSIEFSIGYKTNTTGTTGNACIPLEILGINELQHSDGSEIVFTNEMVCTPFRNTTPSGSTLTFAEAGTYIITYMYNATPVSDADPQVVSGTMNIKKMSAIATSDNNFSGSQYKVCQRIYIVEVTAGTVIQGKIATANSVGFAVKID